MNSIGLQETKSRHTDAGHDNGGRDFEGSEPSPTRNGSSSGGGSGEIITTRVFVHNESSNWGEVSRPFELDAKSSATVADMIDQREFNQTIS